MDAPTTVIDDALCNGCGLCVKVCPSLTLSMVEGKARVTGDRSIHCGHCAAICPTGAVTVGGLDASATSLTTVENRDRWLPYGKFDAASLVQLMKSRRSSRLFLDRPVPREVLEDLVKVAITAPSGTNSQLWTFTILPDRSSVERLGGAVADFFRRLNKLAESRLARTISRVFMKDALGQYWREYYQAVKEGLEEYERTGRDRLFHGAPAAILIGSLPGASCPAEDALLAAGHILLAAHAMGYGTCLVGFVVEAIRHDARLRRLLSLRPGERIHAVVAVGKAKEWYKRPALRKKVVPRYWTG
ncbi:MAG: 4Fe-4S dicluster domain-containing protein [Deltaproteobacteria bacterium]|nr:MAG: 4Fe-4S dicluster domain-containing protein [Deltaproteobacteria bacterium]